MCEYVKLLYAWNMHEITKYAFLWKIVKIGKKKKIEYYTRAAYDLHILSSLVCYKIEAQKKTRESNNFSVQLPLHITDDTITATTVVVNCDGNDDTHNGFDVTCSRRSITVVL